MLHTPTGLAAEFRVRSARPTLDRWMYPFNFQPGVRPIAPTYGSFDPRFDTRDAQLLLGWDTGGEIPARAGASNYLLRSVRVIVTSVAPVPPIRPFLYDPSHDRFETYVTNPPVAIPDVDAGRPIELFGVGYRGGLTAETFREDSSFGPLGPIASGNISIGTRHAYAADFDDQGELRDIANHVGQLNASWTNAPFEVRPWAVGIIPGLEPGTEVPDGGRMTFELNLEDPWVQAYVQRALDDGRLRLTISSLSPAGQSTPGGTGAGGGGAYPWWATKENLLYDPASLEIDGTVVGSEDTDGDSLPDDWERFWIGNLTSTGTADPDEDRMNNLAEMRAGTDPMDRTSDLRAVLVGNSESRDLRIRFRIAPNRRYRMESSTDLAVWSEASGQTKYPEAGTAEWISADGWNASARFLRVRVE